MKDVHEFYRDFLLGWVSCLDSTRGIKRNLELLSKEELYNEFLKSMEGK